MNNEFDIFSSTKQSLEMTDLSQDESSNGRPLILIVDDDSSIRDALKVILGKKYDLIICENGAEAIEKVNSHIHAVVLDIKMEGKNGFETFIEIKKKNLYLPIIFHSAYQDLKNPFEIINDYRPFGYVVKEGEGKELQDTLESAVDYYLQISKNAVLLKELEKSEKNYRDLVENSLDIIFSLDIEERILSINQSVTKILRYSPEDVINKKFSDLIFKSNSVNEKIVEEKFQELFRSNEIVSFNCDLITKFGEPKEMHLKLKYLSLNGAFIIYGSASSVEEDLLLRLCVAEKQTYKIGNFLTHVDVVSQRIANAAEKYCGQETSFHLKLCLRELMINAMEHGNLGISFEEKSESLINGSYIQLLMDRQKDPINSNKKITIEYTLTENLLEVSITDEGEGFDHKKMLERSLSGDNGQILGHGRGIGLSKNYLERLDYNEKGNSVFFSKTFS